MIRFLVWHVLVVIVSCELYTEESAYVVPYAHNYHNYQPRDYHFNYAVSDPHTGDHKQQWEVKEKGVVRGGYSLLEPDGTTRVVEYIADHDGFRAVVNKIGTAVHPEPVHQVPIVPLSVAHYKTYDGYAGNYANAYGNQNLELLSHPQAVGVVPPPEVSHSLNHAEQIVKVVPQTIISNQGYGDGIVPGIPTATAVPLAEEKVNVVAVPNHNINLGHIQEVAPHSFSPVPANFNLASLVPDFQVKTQAVPQLPVEGVAYHAQPNLANLVAVQNQNVLKVEDRNQVVPQINFQSIPVEGVAYQAQPNIDYANLAAIQNQPIIKAEDRSQVVPHVNNVQSVPIEGVAYQTQPNLHFEGIQNQNVFNVENRGQVVPVQSFDKIEGIQNVDVQAYQPQNVEKVVHIPAVPYNPEAVPAVRQNVQYDVPGYLQRNQPQGQYLGGENQGQHYEVPQSPELVPANPSYSTTIEYQSPSINPQGSYSQNVLEVVPGPVKREKPSKQQKFLIHYQ